MADSLDMKLEIKGAEQVKQMLTNIGADMNDLKGAMDDVGKSTINYFSGQVFTSRGQTINGGQRWQRLSEPYASYKAKKFGNGKPLLVRGGKGSEGMRTAFTKDVKSMSVTIGNSASYFKYHQSSDTRYVLPRRAMIGIYNGMQADVTATIARAISKRIKSRTG